MKKNIFILVTLVFLVSIFLLSRQNIFNSIPVSGEVYKMRGLIKDIGNNSVVLDGAYSLANSTSTEYQKTVNLIFDKSSILLKKVTVIPKNPPRNGPFYPKIEEKQGLFFDLRKGMSVLVYTRSELSKTDKANVIKIEYSTIEYEK